MQLPNTSLKGPEIVLLNFMEAISASAALNNSIIASTRDTVSAATHVIHVMYDFVYSGLTADAKASLRAKVCANTDLIVIIQTPMNTTKEVGDIVSQLLGRNESLVTMSPVAADTVSFADAANAVFSGVVDLLMAELTKYSSLVYSTLAEGATGRTAYTARAGRRGVVTTSLIYTASMCPGADAGSSTPGYVQVVGVSGPLPESPESCTPLEPSALNPPPDAPPP